MTKEITHIGYSGVGIHADRHIVPQLDDPRAAITALYDPQGIPRALPNFCHKRGALLKRKRTRPKVGKVSWVAQTWTLYILLRLTNATRHGCMMF